MATLFSGEAVTLFEVDTPATQACKLSALEQADIPREGVRYVTADFTVEGGWAQALLEAGCSTSEATLVVWEGVTAYLSREDVLRSLQTFRDFFCPGSLIAFDYLSTAYVNQPQIKNLTTRIAEPWDFALEPA